VGSGPVDQRNKLFGLFVTCEVLSHTEVKTLMKEMGEKKLTC
jgi:hypothetical protein